ncbi:hypothetical protein GCM10023084_42870 [Streptomyces lacrimifluminis]|uniref:Uncharacterized protein n=1 Tax=Streptomyces lacrimifluminis TaxID=1500077 RepID=A0A917KF76_9ACTN|nr:hypothetical protein GCM10012282_05460 [Streptomyces lacrimifluminis]
MCPQSSSRRRTARTARTRTRCTSPGKGKPYLLRVDSKSAKDPGTVVFSDYDKPVAARKPSGEILDLDALGG